MSSGAASFGLRRGGGPAGGSDNFLKVVATGGGGQGSKLSILNDLWSGNYLTAGYGGDSQFNPSISSSRRQTVNA